MSRLFHSAVSFAIVLGAYWIYALAAVPLIEPSIAGPSGINGESGFSEPDADQSVKLLEGLFPPNAEILKNPIILENAKVKLLMKNYKNLGDGRVELHPCVMIFLWDGPAEDEAQRRRQSVILEAPQGAILKFDQPINLSSLRIGRLIGGSLLGKITIRSKGKLPGPEDDLLILTSDVQLSEKEVWTPNPVEFTWGKNAGKGQDMHIKLLAGPSNTGGNIAAPNIAGVESFEIRRIERLYLESNPSTPAVSPPTNRSAATNPQADFDNSPVEITCRGPFTFNVVKRVATFSDHVDVRRLNPNGPSDQIQCELLSLYFTTRNDSNPDNDNSSNLEPERIEARGRPVDINAPAQNLTGRGERLQYNIKTKLISLEGGPEVYLHQGPNKIHGRSLQYKPASNNRLGSAAAQGPGWLRAQTADKSDQCLEARFNDKLRLFPQEQNHVISFTGGAVLDYAGMGHMEADEIFFWLKELPPGGASGQARIQPDRMMARKQVTISSPQFSVAVDQLETWFEPQQETGSAKNGTVVERSAAPVAVFGAEHSATPVSFSNRQKIANPTNNTPVPSQDVKQHYKISGSILRARIKMQDQQDASLAEITMENGFRLEETQTASPDERPILIQGDRLHGTDISSAAAMVSIWGGPAHFEGRGIGLTGPNINLNRGTSRLWIDGPGRMDLPLANNPAGQSLIPGQPIASTGAMFVEWEKGMDFNGQTAKFEKAVSATTPQMHLQTESLEVKLVNPIGFSNPNVQGQAQPAVEELLCRSGVFLENRSSDARGQPTSFDRLQVADLAVNVQSGALSAGGPGWLNSVSLGSSDPKQNQFGGGLLAAGSAPQTANNSANLLYCLHVRFQGSITGNLRQGELIFQDQIRAAYAPVPDWSAMIDADKPQNLGPQAVLLHCDRLKVNQMSLPTSDGKTIEVQASENAVVESGSGIYTARAQRITYAKAKDQLIIEGDGRTDAELFRQLQPGAEFTKVAAHKIIYYPSTNRLNIDGARPFEINQGK